MGYDQLLSATPLVPNHESIQEALDNPTKVCCPSNKKASRTPPPAQLHLSREHSATAILAQKDTSEARIFAIAVRSCKATCPTPPYLSLWHNLSVTTRRPFSHRRIVYHPMIANPKLRLPITNELTMHGARRASHSSKRCCHATSRCGCGRDSSCTYWACRENLIVGDLSKPRVVEMWRQLSADDIPFSDVVFWCWEGGGEEQGREERSDEGGLHRGWCAW